MHQPGCHRSNVKIWSRWQRQPAHSVDESIGEVWPDRRQPSTFVLIVWLWPHRSSPPRIRSMTNRAPFLRHDTGSAGRGVRTTTASVAGSTFAIDPTEIQGSGPRTAQPSRGPSLCSALASLSQFSGSSGSPTSDRSISVRRSNSSRHRASGQPCRAHVDWGARLL